MNKVTKLLASLLAVVVFAAPVSAKAADVNPWTQCGIGAMIFPSTPVGAVISNVIWDLGTTAVTSAGLSKNTCEGKGAKMAMFVGTTYANLEEETVQGGGQHVSAMLNLASCQPASHDAILSSVRADFAQSLRDPAYQQKDQMARAEGYFNLVQAKVSGQFATQCQSL